MEERRLTVGQRASEPDDPRDNSSIGMASMAEADVLVVADGGMGLPPSRAAADTVVRSVTKAIRLSPARRPSTLLGEAFGVAHRDVVKLERESLSAGRLAAGCIAAHVQSGVATVARSGRLAAFHVRSGAAEPVFPETVARGHAGLGPSPLGMGADEPPPIEIEVVPLLPGDRLVLTTAPVAARVDVQLLGRTVWGFEPQVAANRLAELVAPDAASLAIQVARREAPSLGTALDLLDPGRLRSEGRREDERRTRDRLDRHRRIAIGAFWGVLGLVVAVVVGSWLLGYRGGGDGGEGAPVEVGAVDAGRADSGRAVAAADVVGGSYGLSRGGGTMPAAAPSVVAPADVRQRSETAGADVTVHEIAAADAIEDSGSALPPELAELDEIFLLEPDEAAVRLKRHIIKRYAAVGTEIFGTLDAYVTLRPGRRTVEVLVELLDRRPPPRTRRWIRGKLLELTVGSE